MKKLLRLFIYLVLLYTPTTSQAEYEEFLVASEEDDGSHFYTSGWESSGGAGFGYYYYTVAGLDGPAHGAIRFSSITIPQGTEINSAILYTLQSQNPGLTSYGRGTIYGVDADNTVQIPSGYNPAAQTRTTASVASSSVVNLTNSTDEGAEVLYDVTDIVQEIVDRGGWSSGNAITFVIIGYRGTASNPGYEATSWYTYSDGGSALLIDYEAAAPSTDIVSVSGVDEADIVEVNDITRADIVKINDIE